MNIHRAEKGPKKGKKGIGGTLGGTVWRYSEFFNSALKWDVWGYILTLREAD
jgi:hypothetical protein